MVYYVYPLDGCWVMMPDNMVQHLRTAFAVVEVDHATGAKAVADLIHEAQQAKDDPSWIELLQKLQPLALQVHLADSANAREGYLEFLMVPMHNIVIESPPSQDEGTTRGLVQRCVRALPMYVCKEVAVAPGAVPDN